MAIDKSYLLIFKIFFFLDKILLSHYTNSNWTFILWLNTYLGFLTSLFFFLNLRLIKIYLCLYGFCCFVIMVSWLNYVLKQIGINLYGHFYVRSLLIHTHTSLYACALCALKDSSIYFFIGQNFSPKFLRSDEFLKSE